MVTARAGPSGFERPPRRRERAWVRAAQAGSDEAMEALFRVHWGPAHRAAYLIVHDAAAAEDIAQEAFLSALRALDRFDRRRPFGPWLHRIVVNRAIDWSRARALRREVAEAVESEAPPERSEIWSDEVVAALAALDPDQRAAVVLRHLLEYTPGEIAAVLEIPRGTVNSRLRRALDRLAVELAPGEETGAPGESPPSREAAASGEAAPSREAAASGEAAPSREAAASGEAPPSRDSTPPRGGVSP